MKFKAQTFSMYRSIINISEEYSLLLSEYMYKQEYFYYNP